MKRWRRRGEFPTIVAGWRRAVAWLIKHGPVRAVGVEGTSSYGVGIITELRTAGIAVVEVNRTRAAEKRRPGKTDPLDRSVLSGEATTGPKSPTIEPLRVLRQQATRRQINAVLVNADPALHDLPDAELLAALRNRRPEQLHHSDNADTMFALRALARRHRILQEEITDLEQRLLHRSTRTNPALMAFKGVGPAVGAQLLITAGDDPDRLRTSASFAALCGTVPIPLTCGKTSRHRLCRGGDRQANAALHHYPQGPHVLPPALVCSRFVSGCGLRIKHYLYCLRDQCWRARDEYERVVGAAEAAAEEDLVAVGEVRDLVTAGPR